MYGEMHTAWNRGVGYSAPLCTSFSDLYQHEQNEVHYFVGFLIAIVVGLYVLIEPQHILSIKYVLAVLYSFYAIGVLVLVYQAWRNCDFQQEADEQTRDQERVVVCGICNDSYPLEDLLTFDCPGAHSYHEDCFLSLIYRIDRPYVCPGCNEVRPVRQKTYGRRESNFLDRSRLMWYINSLISRRIPLLVCNFSYPIREPRQTAAPMRERALLQALTMVIVVHMLCITSLILYIYVVSLINTLPFGWLARFTILLYATFFMRLIASHGASLYMPYRQGYNIMKLWNWLALLIEYSFRLFPLFVDENTTRRSFLLRRWEEMVSVINSFTFILFASFIFFFYFNLALAFAFSLAFFVDSFLGTPLHIGVLPLILFVLLCHPDVY